MNGLSDIENYHVYIHSMSATMRYLVLSTSVFVSFGSSSWPLFMFNTLLSFRCPKRLSHILYHRSALKTSDIIGIVSNVLNFLSLRLKCLRSNQGRIWFEKRIFSNKFELMKRR